MTLDQALNAAQRDMTNQDWESVQISNRSTHTSEYRWYAAFVEILLC